jgi:hypothetical protein
MTKRVGAVIVPGKARDAENGFFPSQIPQRSLAQSQHQPGGQHPASHNTSLFVVHLKEPNLSPHA